MLEIPLRELTANSPDDGRRSGTGGHRMRWHAGPAQSPGTVYLLGRLETSGRRERFARATGRAFRRAPSSTKARQEPPVITFEAVSCFTTARSVASRRGFQARRLTVGRWFQLGRTLGLPAVPVRELLDRLTIRGLEILSMRLRHRGLDARGPDGSARRDVPLQAAAAGSPVTAIAVSSAPDVRARAGDGRVAWDAGVPAGAWMCAAPRKAPQATGASSARGHREPSRPPGVPSLRPRAGALPLPPAGGRGEPTHRPRFCRLWRPPR